MARFLFFTEFQLDDKSKNFITEALIKYKKITDSLDINLLEFLDFGRNTCKKHKVSPDSIMQLAFQVAVFYFYLTLSETSQSLLTSIFLLFSDSTL